jgi:hypothetical protein
MFVLALRPLSTSIFRTVPEHYAELCRSENIALVKLDGLDQKEVEQFAIRELGMHTTCISIKLCKLIEEKCRV